MLIDLSVICLQPIDSAGVRLSNLRSARNNKDTRIRKNDSRQKNSWLPDVTTQLFNWRGFTLVCHWIAVCAKCRNVDYSLTSFYCSRITSASVEDGAFSNDHSGKHVGTLLPSWSIRSRAIIHDTSPFFATNFFALRNGHKYSAGRMPLNREWQKWLS